MSLFPSVVDLNIEGINSSVGVGYHAYCLES